MPRVSLLFRERPPHAERHPPQRVGAKRRQNDVGRENEDRDRFVRRDRVYRSPHQLESEGVKVLLEVQEMLNPDTAIYPHAGEHCSWCPFEEPCIALDDGEEWEFMLQDDTLYVKRTEESRSWQTLAQHPVMPVLRRGSPILQRTESLPLQPPMSLSLDQLQQQQLQPAPLPEDL